MPSRVSAAPFCAPRSEAAIAVYPASASSSVGVGTAGSVRHPGTSGGGCPELAAATDSAAGRVWAAGAPRVARRAAVAAHRSDLLEVAMTAPGADSTNGIACAVVLPDRGAMKATIVSSQLA